MKVETVLSRGNPKQPENLYRTESSFFLYLYFVLQSTLKGAN